MLSGDLRIFYDSKSPTADRMREYGAAFGAVDVLLFIRHRGGGRDFELSPHARVYMASGRFWRFVTGFLRGAGLIQKNHYDVVVAQDIEHAGIAWLWSLFYKTPWQMQIHTDILNPYFWRESFTNKLRVLFAKFLVPRANGIRVVSQRIKESLLRTTNYKLSTDIVVLPIFVDIQKITDAPITTDLHKKYPQFNFLVLMASRLTGEKNIGLAVEAMKSLVKTHSKAGLVIAGDGPEKENLQRMAYGAQLRDSIVFENWTGDLASYYKTADLFLLTSNYEGYGLTLIEAAAAGCKIISSDVGIAPEILSKENIFKVGDVGDLTVKLNSAIAGNIQPAKPLSTQTKEQYLRLYKDSLELCIKK